MFVVRRTRSRIKRIETGKIPVNGHGKGGEAGWFEKLMAKFQFANIKPVRGKQNTYPQGRWRVKAVEQKGKRSIGLKANVQKKWKQQQQQNSTSYAIKIG